MPQHTKKNFSFYFVIAWIYVNFIIVIIEFDARGNTFYVRPINIEH